MKYVDVILPLKLNQAFTYLATESIVLNIEIGKRVIVPFGKNKFYSGIVIHIHSNKPHYPQIKEIQEVLDESPILSFVQIQFWQWLAEYYMCTVGEVMDTALPNYFKLSGERFFKITDAFLNEFHIENYIAIEETTMLFNSILSTGQLSLKEIKEQFGNKNAMASLNKLIDIGAVEPIDIVKEKYRPVYENYIKISDEYVKGEKLNGLFSLLEKKSPKQYKILLTYFSLSKPNIKVSKPDLINRSDSNYSTLKLLVDKGVFLEYKEQKDRFEVLPVQAKKTPILSESQTEIYQNINTIFNDKNVVLLKGITGSGKTEIYIQLIQDRLAQGQTCLFILPEITLTQQIVSRFNQYFGDEFIVYHSLISQNKRFEIWKKIMNRQIKLIVGTRSSIFLPYQNLDFIIIDEEHDSSLKQTDSHPKFHFRDSIIHYSQSFRAKILLGSATPSSETYYNVLNGKYGYVELNERFGNAQLPIIELINLRDKEVALNMKSFYSEYLLKQVAETINRGEQAILFQNRRGYSPYIQCNTCGFVQKCDQCDVRLTYHSNMKLLICHYCNKKYTLKNTCRECKSSDLKAKGLGTQKVEEEIELFLPNLKLGRLDYDTANTTNKIDAILSKFKEKEFDVLIGTQMVAKGLDFENLTLLGVLQADNLFSFIDYKTDEKAFQTLSQVSGRVGRGELLGKVLIQTSNPENRIIQAVILQDWKNFITNELENRKKFIYPPYCKLIKISIKHLKEDLTNIYAQKITEKISKEIKSIVLGPITPPISRIRNQYIREIIIKLPKSKELNSQKLAIKSIIDSELMTLNNKNFTIDILVDA